MNEDFAKQILNGLCKYYGYRIVELDKIDGLVTFWAAAKTVQGAETNVMVIAEREDFDTFGLKHALMEKFENSNIKIVKLVIKDTIDESYESSGMDDFSIQLGLKDRRIWYKDREVNEIAGELVQCINRQNTGEKTSKYIPWVTFAIIALNILVYIITAIQSNNFFDMNVTVLVNMGAKYNDLISAGEYYRFVTCMFLHGGLLHIGLNMYSLYAVGPFCEEVYGKVKYIAIYFIAGITASLFSYIFSNDISVGASGAIFGILGAVLIYAMKLRKRIGRGFLTNILSVIIANLVLGFSIPNIDNFAHLGGLVGGALVAYVMTLTNKNMFE